MKIKPIFILLIATNCATYSNAAPQPLFGLLNNLVNTAGNLIGGVLGAVTVVQCILGGIVGGILGGVINSGVGGQDSGDQSENVAKIILQLFKILKIPIVECNSDFDCRGIGTEVCSPIPGYIGAEKICQVTIP